MKISIADLYRMKACTEQAALFVSTFGLDLAVEGVRITYDNLTMAFNAALDIPWLVGSLHIDMSSVKDDDYHACNCDMCITRHALSYDKSGEVFGLIVAWAREQDQKTTEDQPTE